MLLRRRKISPPQFRVLDLFPGPVFCFFGAIAFVCGCNSKPESLPSEKPAAVPVQTVQPTRGPITRFITLPGEIKPYQQATLYAKVAGYLRTIHVDKGDLVKEGSLLAELEVPELLADRTRYRAEVDVADIDFKRLSQSQKKAPDLVTPQSVDDARGKLEIARANLERNETLLNYAKICAPFSGIITRRMVDSGAFIPAASSGGAPESAAIVTLMDFTRVRLQVAVPEIEASRVAIGQPVKLTVEGAPGAQFEGKVTRYSYALDEATKTMLAEIELPNPESQLRPGMYATVRIGIEHKDDALLVPVDALVTEKVGASLFVLVDNQAKKTRVQTGFNDGQHVEITNGLDLDQKVILIGKRSLTDGQPVSISESK
jgi:RND family efflux transporter MFP subunit